MLAVRLTDSVLHTLVHSCTHTPYANVGTMRIGVHLSLALPADKVGNLILFRSCLRRAPADIHAALINKFVGK